jgi:O-methyltransferase
LRCDTATGIDTTTTPLECSEIWQWAKSLEKIPGDMAELGVYNGATAAIMLKAAPSKTLHLFDTFEGLPDSEGKFDKGEWNGSLESVKRNLSQWKGVVYHTGFFPASADQFEARFSFVHLDADLYMSTKAALEWFWPRLNIGGAILSHDFPLSEGVVRAFNEFFRDKPEPFIPLSGSQCVAVKSR